MPALRMGRVKLMPHKTEVLTTHTPALFQAAVRRAAELLRAGEVVALPTETVYGLAANALDPQNRGLDHAYARAFPGCGQARRRIVARRRSRGIADGNCLWPCRKRTRPSSRCADL